MPENPRKHHVSSRAKTVANRRIGLSAKEIKFLFIYSNIAHHGVPLSVIDGASRNPSEGKGRTFESCWVRQSSDKSLYRLTGVVFTRAISLWAIWLLSQPCVPARSTSSNERAVGWRFASPTASHGKSLLPELCGQWPGRRTRTVQNHRSTHTQDASVSPTHRSNEPTGRLCFFNSNRHRRLRKYN